MRTYLFSGVALGLFGAGTAILTSSARAEELPALSPAVSSPGAEGWNIGDPALGPGAATVSAATTVNVAPPVVQPAPLALSGDYLEPIAAAEGQFAGTPYGSACSSCNGDAGLPFGARGFYNRCGCNTPLFPYIAGPGNCDNWCVGPHWNVEVDGLTLRRENAAWADVGIGPAGVIDQFDFGPGARIFATGYNYSNYGVQAGYEGVNDFNSTAITTDDRIDYESTLNSVEVNVLRRTAIPLRVFAGARYIDLREDYLDLVTGTGGGGAVGDSDRVQVDNRLMGFQVGALRDAWQLNRWITIEPYGNAGVYFNDFARDDTQVDATTGVYASQQYEFSEIAYVGEAGVTSILRINRCLALRGGYQFLALNGVATALDASLGPAFNTDTLIYHGARFGIEYQR